MRTAVTAALRVAAIIGVGLAFQVAGAAAQTNCGVISSKTWGRLWLTPNHIERLVVVRGVSCSVAKRIAHDYDYSPMVNQPAGWSCFSSNWSQPYLFACGRGVQRQSYRQYFKVTRA